MKKIFSMMMIAVAAISFVACGEKSTSTGTGTGTGTGNGNGEKLETPAPEATDVTETGFTVTWAAIANADSYTVNLKGKNYTTAETSYTFQDLNAGEYTVRVKATGEGYKDSDFGQVVVTLTGATSVNWFESSVKPAEVNEEEGYGPYNAVEFTWKGTGVKSLAYGIYFSDNLIGVSDANIIAELDLVDDATVAEVNSAEGLSGVIGPIPGGSTFTMCILVTNEAGVEFFSKEEVTTEAAVPSAEAEAWFGTWEVQSTKAYSIDQAGTGTIIDSADTFTVTITASPDSPNTVIVDGFSVLGAGFTTTGEVEGNQLFILNGTYLGQSEDNSYGFYWLGWFSIDGGKVSISMNAYPSNVVTLDGTSATSTNEYNLYYEDGTPAPTVCYCSDVFGVTSEGSIYFLIEQFPGVYRTGAMTWTKTGAAPSAMSASRSNAPAMLSSVVLR